MMNVIPKRNMNMISLMTIPVRLSNYYDNIDVNNRSLTLTEKYYLIKKIFIRVI